MAGAGKRKRPRGAAARRPPGLLAVAVACFLLCAAVAAADREAEERPEARDLSWRVIVHPANPLHSMDRDELERIYRRRSRYWKDGSEIFPLNLPGGDALRRAFSEEILRDDEEELAVYWNRQYFQGIAPPVVLQSSSAVRAYVAATPSAVGYVRSEDVDASVAVVEVKGEH